MRFYLAVACQVAAVGCLVASNVPSFGASPLALGALAVAVGLRLALTSEYERG